MRNLIERILYEYIEAKKAPFTGHPMGAFFRNDIPNAIYQTGLVDANTHLITGSVGKGNWAMVPWVCIFDRKITTSAVKGVYIVYLLSKDGKTLYLTLNQGCTEIRNSHSKAETIKIMRKNAAAIISKIDSRGFSSDENIDLGSGLTELGELYQKGIIFHKAYHRDGIPANEELLDDLRQMMGIYQEYAATLENKEPKKALEKEPSRIGTFDSWEIVDEKTAIKHCDKSFFEHNGSGVPKGICWFFGAEGMESGETKQISILFGGKAYQSRVSNESSDRRRVRIFWNAELGNLFGAYNTPDATATFRKVAENTYTVTMNGGESVIDGTMLEKLIIVFQNIGGQGYYSDIYSAYEKLTKEEMTANRKAGIRRTIEINSSDSEAFSGKDVFYSVEGKGKGLWGLRGYRNELTTKEKIAAIKSYIAARGFNYEGDLIENFYLSLKSKPFVILAGTSGTGKTRLVKLFAEAIGAQMKLVPVRPDWSDSSDLFGHTDLSNTFRPGAIIDFIKQAEWNKDTPHFICLDEMNLARVEYYLSDILSIIETRDRKDNGRIETDPLLDETYFKKVEDQKKYGRVYLPENLYIIGTVNMDETTFPFSKKVLDRANTIEFSFVNLMSRPTAGVTAAAQKLNNSFLMTDYLYLGECDDADLMDSVCMDLEELNQILVKANLHVGYRVRDEIAFYMMNNKKADLLTEDAAMDHEIMQKILPRIQGSSSAIKNVLAELFKKCAGDYAGFNGSAAYEQMEAYLDSRDCKYPNSAKKIAFMMRRYEEDGFTSYWL